MPLPYRLPVCVLLLLSLIFRVGLVAAQDRPDVDLQLGDAYKLSDREAQRRRSNAPYLGVPITGRVARRFEMYSPHSEQDLRELKSMGFTQVILDWPNLHAAATQAGLKVVLANWWIDKTLPEDVEQGVQRAREVHAESLIGFSVMDEPGRNSPDTPFRYYIDLYERLRPRFREEFPETRLEISHWGPMANWNEGHYENFSLLYQAADVMRIMPYPDLHEAPLDDVFFMVHRSRKLMQMAQRELPLVVILQTWVLPPDNKLPEIGELRVMAYQALLSGAETVSFFDYNTEVWDQTAGFREGFRELMAELTAFSLQHREDMVTSTVDADGVLAATLLSPTGVQTAVVINTRRHAVRTLQPLEIQTVVDLSPIAKLKIAQAEQASCCQATAGQALLSTPACVTRPAVCRPTPRYRSRSCSPISRLTRQTQH